MTFDEDSHDFIKKLEEFGKGEETRSDKQAKLETKYDQFDFGDNEQVAEKSKTLTWPPITPINVVESKVALSSMLVYCISV